jgi:hypothetical protein
MLFVPLTSLDEELLPGDGLWNRERLRKMNEDFVAVVERAFELGLESRAAAGATVRVGSSLNGRMVESAIGAAYDRLCDRKGQMAAVEIISLVRELCPGISYARIRSEFDRQFKQRGAEWV